MSLLLPAAGPARHEEMDGRFVQVIGQMQRRIAECLGALSALRPGRAGLGIEGLHRKAERPDHGSPYPWPMFPGRVGRLK